jgi:hypothetical protein
MNHWSDEELAFRCERLSMRMERLAQNFLQMSTLSHQAMDEARVCAMLRESKVFLELIAIDLEVETAFELAQMQRQLSRWHVHWAEVWATDSSRLEISTLTQAWTIRLQAMAGVLV